MRLTSKGTKDPQRAPIIPNTSPRPLSVIDPPGAAASSRAAVLTGAAVLAPSATDSPDPAAVDRGLCRRETCGSGTFRPFRIVAGQPTWCEVYHVGTPGLRGPPRRACGILTNGVLPAFCRVPTNGVHSGRALVWRDGRRQLQREPPPHRLGGPTLLDGGRRHSRVFPRAACKVRAFPRWARKGPYSSSGCSRRNRASRSSISALA